MQNNLGIAAVIAFGIVVLNASANALDTSGNAFGAIIANDYTTQNSVLTSRISIIVIAILGWAISTFNLPMTYIFLTYGVLRITLFIITMLAVGTDLLNRYGIIYSILIIAPYAVYLNLNGMKLEATIVGFFATPILSIVISRNIKEKHVTQE
jgi:hypothetical protein